MSAVRDNLTAPIQSYIALLALMHHVPILIYATQDLALYI